MILFATTTTIIVIQYWIAIYYKEPKKPCYILLSILFVTIVALIKPIDIVQRLRLYSK